MRNAELTILRMDLLSELARTNPSRLGKATITWEQLILTCGEVRTQSTDSNTAGFVFAGHSNLEAGVRSIVYFGVHPVEHKVWLIKVSVGNSSCLHRSWRRLGRRNPCRSTSQQIRYEDEYYARKWIEATIAFPVGWIASIRTQTGFKNEAVNSAEETFLPRLRNHHPTCGCMIVKLRRVTLAQVVFR